MKKKLILFLMTATCAFAAAGSPAASVSAMAAEAPAAAQTGNTESYASELTGLPISSALAAQRPVAVMIDNDLRALPHAGLADADVVYEMMNSTANNRVTRLMAVYKDWQSVGQIGNIRSTRPTNILLASEWDAILIHDGGPFYNNPYFASTGIRHLSGGFSRIRNGKPSEFTEYAKGSEISRRAAAGGISAFYTTPVTQTLAQTHFSFAPTDLAQLGGVSGVLCQLSCFRHTKPYLSYNAATGLYDYYEGSKPAVDSEDKQSVAFRNILLQDCTFTQYDRNGYLICNVIGEGSGWYLTGGKAVPILWKKASETAPTKYYYASGTEITLNPGKTYIGICPSDDWQSVGIS